MNLSNQLLTYYEFGTRRYILSRTELRCQDSAVPSENFVVRLNQVNPNYYYTETMNFFILGVIVFVAVVCITFRMDTAVLSCVLAYRLFYQDNNNGYHFRSLIENKLVFTIPCDDRSKNKAKTFIQSLAKNIYEAPLSNLSVLELLSSYQLLTQIELAQLDAGIRAGVQPDHSGSTNVIQLKNYMK